MTTETLRLLYKHLQRTGRSLLQYVHDSFPWVEDSDDAEAVRALEQMAKEEQEVVAAATRYLLKRHLGAPYLGQYPMSFTTMNYLSLDRLLPILHDEQAKDVKELDSDLTSITEDDAKELLQKLLETRKRHLDALTELNSRHTATAAS